MLVLNKKKTAQILAQLYNVYDETTNKSKFLSVTL